MLVLSNHENQDLSMTRTIDCQCRLDKKASMQVLAC